LLDSEFAKVGHKPLEESRSQQAGYDQQFRAQTYVGVEQVAVDNNTLDVIGVFVVLESL